MINCSVGAHLLSFEDIGQEADDAINIHYACNLCGATGFKTLYSQELEWESENQETPQ